MIGILWTRDNVEQGDEVSEAGTEKSFTLTDPRRSPDRQMILLQYLQDDGQNFHKGG